MNLLLVDAGNARLKWALSDGNGIGPIQSVEYSQDPGQAVAALSEAARGNVDAIAVSNVAGDAFAAALNRAVGRRSDCSLWYARSSGSAGGVRNAYAQPGNLGVDRWAAVVAGYARLRAAGSSGALCVADAGTALTIDAVENDGTHIGGLILPGPELQRAALLDSTADIARNARTTSDPTEGLAMFAADTASAVAGSAEFACAAAIDRCMSALAARAGEARLLLAGGDAGAIAPWLASRFEICPNLVLEGLEILFEQRNSE